MVSLPSIHPKRFNFNEEEVAKLFEIDMPEYPIEMKESDPIVKRLFEPEYA